MITTTSAPDQIPDTRKMIKGNATSPPDTVQKSSITQRARKRFCQREIEIEGKTIRFELWADGIRVRRKHARKVRTLTFAEAWHVVNGQGLLGL